ncbi:MULTISPECIES: sigma-70 family RNA polymerase sigma factor [unclassified Dyella]|jgi:RNA polymerase sigma-70 factor (ECF subfamily)|uniref:sigma-70 family RNA polymerase sigma factor n=1 Tax=unclassified Dyella TaxID=2634549 RepID=UPI003F8E58DB
MNARTCPKQDTEASDRLLLERIADGDRDALATLYYGYYESLCAFLYRLTRHAEIIDEVINECFWIVWQKAAGFRQASLVSTWIMGIAYRAGLKALRRRGAEPVDGDNVNQYLIPSTDPEEVRELRDGITKGLTPLKPNQRLVFEPVYGIGHSLDDVATITGVPVGTVGNGVRDNWA